MAQSIELDNDVMALVRCEAEVQNRSVSEQITHWLHIGRAIEMSDDFDHARVSAALAGELQTTDLTALEKAVWSEKFLEKMSEPGPGEEDFFANLHRSPPLPDISFSAMSSARIPIPRNEPTWAACGIVGCKTGDKRSGHSSPWAWWRFRP